MWFDMRSRVFTGLLCGVLLAAGAASALAANGGGTLTPPRSPRNANYTIEARLEPETRSIRASETITWRNLTTTTVNELQFHLYWNAWKSPRTTFMREQALEDGARARREPS